MPTLTSPAVFKKNVLVNIYPDFLTFIFLEYILWFLYIETPPPLLNWFLDPFFEGGPIWRHFMPTLVQFCPIFYMYWRAWHYMTTLLLLMQQFLCQPITALDYMFHSMRAQQITVHFSYLATVEQKKSRSTDNCFLRLCRAPRGLQGPQPSAGARRLDA